MTSLSLETALIWGLTGLDVGVLFAVGVLASALVWFVVQTAKQWTEIDAPIVWKVSPIALGVLVTLVGLPAALEGVAPEHTVPHYIVAIAIVVLGLACGVGARGAHRWARRVMVGTLGRIADWITDGRE